MRKSWDAHFINIAEEVASMGTCIRRQCGCVLVDERRVILSTGFNGVPPRWDHCRDNLGHECPGAKSPSGADLDSCLATHAEINALLHCADVTKVRVAYCTASPCISCVKALLCTCATRVVFLELYPHKESEELWTRHHLVRQDARGRFVDWRTWEQLQPDGITRILASSEDR